METQIIVLSLPLLHIRFLLGQGVSLDIHEERIPRIVAPCSTSGAQCTHTQEEEDWSKNLHHNGKSEILEN